MSEVEAVSANNSVAEENSQNDKGAKSKKSKASRVSTFDRTKEEGEAITKGIGGEVSEGRRLTRSAAKGVTATPPPPAKKERKTPQSKGRGRPKKGVQNATEETDSHDENKEVASVESEVKNDEAKNDAPVENNTHEEKEELANNNAVSKETTATENGAKEDGVDASSSEEKKEEKSEKATEEDARPATEAEKAE